MSPAPKYATKRDRANPSFGPRVAMLYKQIYGHDLMPWQRQVIDVGMELDPRDPGAFRYDTVTITVPRQSGKTAALRGVHTDRLICYQDHVTMMTAQTGKAARKRWDQIVQALRIEDHPHHWQRMASRGSESLMYQPSRSTLAPFPPTETDGHGDSLHMVSVDEVWAFSELEGLALDAAINPTMLTILNSQRWNVSTKGTGKSTYLNRLIEEGREAVKDPDSRTAFFEWSADDELAAKDPYGRETLAFHPAIGYTQSYEKILRLGGKESLATWRRSYLNLDDPTGVDAPIDLAIWDSLGVGDASIPEPSQVVLGYDVAEDLSAATIYAAWKGEETIHTSMVETRPGYDWLKHRLIELDTKGYTRRVADPAGGTETIITALDRDGYATKTLSTREYAAACQWLILAAKSGDITHDGQSGVRDALETTARRYISGTPMWDVRKSRGPIDGLRALTVAAHEALTAPISGIRF